MSETFQAPVVLDRVVKVDELIVQEPDRGSLFWDPAAMAQGFRAAVALAASKMVPEHFRHDPQSVFVVLHMARLRGVDPIVLLQNTHMINGKPGWSTEYLVALCRQAGIDLRWQVQRRPVPIQQWEDVSVTCFAHGDQDDTRRATVDTARAIKMGWTRSEKYKQDIARMLMWRSASWWVSLFASEIKLGLATVEDLEDGAANGSPASGSPDPVSSRPTRGLAAIDAVLDSPPPSPAPTASGASTSAPGGVGRAQGGGLPPSPVPSSSVGGVSPASAPVGGPAAPGTGAGPRDARTDAERLRDALVPYGESPVLETAARKAFYAEAGIARCGDDRWRATTRAWVEGGFGRRTDDGSLRRTLPVREQQIAALDLDRDLPPEAGSDDDLVTVIARTQAALEGQHEDPGDAAEAVDECAKAAGLTIGTAGPVVDGATDEQLRAFLDAMRDRVRL